MVPNKWVSNSEVLDGRVDIEGGSFVKEGRRGLNGPPGKTKRRRVRYGSCCAAVPKDARSIARFKSCSRIIDAAADLDVSRASFKRSNSCIRDKLNSPFLRRK